MNITIQEDSLIIKEANYLESILDLKDLFEDYNDNFDLEEIDWGKPVGEEVW